MKRWLRALPGLFAVLLLVLLLLEAALQLGAWVMQGKTREVTAQWLTGHARILAVGDSNTFGFYLPADESWPAQLEHLWNAQYPGQPVEVLNLGYPGTNSFRVRDNLPGLLDTLAPDVVLIMVGFNDFWTPVEQVDLARQDWLGWLKGHSRVYRLYCIASRSRVGQQDLQFGASRDPTAPVDVDNPEQHLVHVDGNAYFLGTLQGEPARKREALADNLTAMVAAVRHRGARVVLLTYPSNWGFYPGANKWIREVAETQAVPLVDITPLFVERCADGPPSCPELLFHDGHATAQGYALVAAKVLETLSGERSR